MQIIDLTVEHAVSEFKSSEKSTRVVLTDEQREWLYTTSKRIEKLVDIVANESRAALCLQLSQFPPSVSLTAGR